MGGWRTFCGVSAGAGGLKSRFISMITPALIVSYLCSDWYQNYLLQGCFDVSKAENGNMCICNKVTWMTIAWLRLTERRYSRVLETLNLLALCIEDGLPPTYWWDGGGVSFVCSDIVESTYSTWTMADVDVYKY